jgi:hypothetical protein
MTGGAYALGEDGRAPGGGAFIMLRLLRRRPKAGDDGAALTVPAELTDCMDSFELVLVCCDGAPCWFGGLADVAARRVKGLVAAGGPLG